MLRLTCRVFGSGFLAQQGSLASCEVVVEQSRAQDYSGQQVEVFQVRMYIDQDTRSHILDANGCYPSAQVTPLTMDMSTNVPEPFTADGDLLKEGLPVGLGDSQVWEVFLLIFVV